MINSLYDMKPLEEWLDPARGCIYESTDAFMALNAVPSTFGHVLIAPKKVVSSLSELTPEERNDFLFVKSFGLDALLNLIELKPAMIIQVYDFWNANPELTKKLPGSVERRALVRKDLEQGPCQGANYFENLGESAGQMIRHFHGQIVPRYGKGKGMGTAIFNLTHPQTQ